jgi:outer membrane protein assembly factor BamD
MTRPLAALLLLSLAAAGCATTSGSGEHSYGADAKSNYDTGMKNLDGKDWVEAQRYLEFVSAKFPYSTYSALADLALGDLYFQQEKFVEAIDKYRSFIKLHPTHPRDDYAALQVANSYYEQIPSDLFFLPASAEKDQTDLRAALVAYGEFLAQYPSSELRPKGVERVGELRHRLADHEMRIGQYYLKHGRAASAAGRFENVVRDYPGAGFDGVAALSLHEAYDKLGQPEKGRDALHRLVKDHPGDPRVGEAKRLLGPG